jgi:phosphoglycolate phosphatase
MTESKVPPTKLATPTKDLPEPVTDELVTDPTNPCGDGAVPRPASRYLHPVAIDSFSCDAYLFDIDGTLLNSRDGVHYHAFHHAVRDVYGIDSSIDGVPVHGNTDVGILRAVVRRAGLSDAQFEAALPQALQHMCDEVSQNQDGLRPELCPSVPDLLEILRASGKLIGVVSGNLDTIGWLKLRAAGIADYFSFGSFSGYSVNGAFATAERRTEIFQNGMRQVRTRLSETASTCFVGDTPSDISAAHELGMPVIAIATGIYALDELRQHKPDTCVSCCADLLSKFSGR